MSKLTPAQSKEPLVCCSSTDAVKLNQAAVDSGNEALLMQIKDKDCVAIEVRYHMTCYWDFTRYLSRPAKTKNPAITSYTKAFEIFSKTVNAKIIDNKKIMRLKELNKLFIKQIHETHGVDASSYKTIYLKQRLIKKFPQLCFIRPHMRSQGYIVYVNDIEHNTVVEQNTLLVEKRKISDTDSTPENDMDVSLQKTLENNLNIEMQNQLICRIFYHSYRIEKYN